MTKPFGRAFTKDLTSKQQHKWERERQWWEIRHVMEEDSISALQSINNQISCDYPSLFHSSRILPSLLLILLHSSSLFSFLLSLPSPPSLHLPGPTLTFSLHARQNCYWLNLGTGCTNTEINLGVKWEIERSVRRPETRPSKELSILYFS